MSCVTQQKLSEDEVVRPQQPNLNSNCQWLCEKGNFKVKVFVRLKFSPTDDDNYDNYN